MILYGSGAEEVRFAYDDGCAPTRCSKPFEGVIPNLERRYRETESEWSREEIERYMTATPCEACRGYRLKPEALAVKIDGKHIGEVSDALGQGGDRLGARCRRSSTPSATRSRSAS